MAVKYTQRRFTEAIKTKKEDFIKANPEKAEAVEDFIQYIKDILRKEVDEHIEKNIPPHI
jgi:hypothetical protein